MTDNENPYWPKFAYVMFLMTIVCASIWGGVIDDHLYHCTDAVGLDYFQPGNWVHGRIEYVKKIDVHRSMSEPDTIKDGWNVPGLWCLWLGLFGASLAVSHLLARVRFFPIPDKDP
jgi:hypothetical protein